MIVVAQITQSKVVHQYGRPEMVWRHVKTIYWEKLVGLKRVFVTNLVNPGSQNTCIFEKQAIPALCNIKKARLSAIFVFTLYPLKRPGFSMVHYSVNQAINDKKSFIKIQDSMFTKCDINNTYKSSGIHVHTSGMVRYGIWYKWYLLFRLQSGRSKLHHWKWTTNFLGFHPTCI